MSNLNLRVAVQGPTGLLELESSPYELQAESRNERAIATRKNEVTNPFIEGTFTIGAVRENVVENLNVWVEARNHHDLDTAVERLLVAYEQLVYPITWDYRGQKRDKATGGTETFTFRQVWSCQPAQVSVTTEQAYQFATMALVKAQVPRLPAVTRSVVDVV